MQNQLEKVVSENQPDVLLLEECQSDPNAFEKIFLLEKNNTDWFSLGETGWST